MGALGQDGGFAIAAADFGTPGGGRRDALDRRCSRNRQ